MDGENAVRSNVDHSIDRSDPAGRILLDPTDHTNWQRWLSAARVAEGDAAVLSRHPRSKALAQGFSVGAYLAQNEDIANAVNDWVEAAFHYLEFGIPENRNGTPDHWNASVVEHVVGVTLPTHLTAPQAASALIAQGISAAELVLNERDLWLSYGLHGPELAAIFHPETYLAAVDAAGLDLPKSDRVSCILHFANVGLDAGLPAHPDHVLDPGFYAASLRALGLPDSPSLRHWASSGLRAGVHANAVAAAQHLYGIRLPVCLTMPSTQALADVMTAPETMLEIFDLHEPVIRTFLIDLAMHIAQRDEPETAKVLLSHVLDADPENARAAVSFADLLDDNAPTDLQKRLRRIAPATFDQGQNRIALAELALRDGQLSEALDLASSLPAEAQSNVALRKCARDIGRKVQAALRRDIPHQLGDMTVQDFQALLTRAIDLYAPTPDRAPRQGPIQRVAILANDDLYQCKLYRADQKADQLRSIGLEVTVFLQSRDVPKLHGQLAQFDAVIFQRSPAVPGIAQVMIEAVQQGLTTFYDIDDLIFDAGSFPPPLETYAGQITQKQHDAIACGVPLFAAAARLCDIGIASTDPIREALAPLTLSGTAFTHRNALSHVHMAALHRAQQTKNKRLVLFYGSGTLAHKEEFREILEPALAAVLAARQNRVEIRLMGDFPDLSHLSMDDPRVTCLPPIWDFESYISALSEADIALSVLAPGPATDAKSELKWMEPAMFAIPSVVSPTQVMCDAVEDGVSGFVADGTEQFVATLLRLIDDPDLRNRVGCAARNRVLAEYALPKMAVSLAEHMNAAKPARKPKLLIANVFFPPQDIGGATRVVADNVTHFLDHNSDTFEVEVLTTLDGTSIPYEVQNFSYSGARVWTISPPNHIDEYAMTDVVMEARIDTLLERIKPDLVHVHCIQRLGVGLIDACRRRGIPYVLTLHDGWWSSPHQFMIDHDGSKQLYDFRKDAPQQPARAHIAHRCITDASACLAVSEPFANLHRDIGLPNVTALPNGVSQLPQRIFQAGPENRVRLGFIGGASRHKGYDLLRAALLARPFENLDLLIVDHALPPGEEVREMWNTTPVLRIPRQPQADVGKLYGRFDVLLAPSIWPESFGLVAREALALGLWVVASDRGAIGADISEDENGFVVSVDDHRALVDVLARMDADAARYTQPPLLKPCLRTAAEQGDDLVEVYKQILNAN